MNQTPPSPSSRFSLQATGARLGKYAALAIAFSVFAVPAAKATVGFTNDLSIAPTGVFYFGAASESVLIAASHGLIVQGANAGQQSTNITKIYNYITLGYNGGDWLGYGLTSHQAAADAAVNGVLGVMLYDNTLLNYGTWQGYTSLGSDPAFNQVLVRTTYLGDYTGDGVVTVDDYGLLDFYFTSALSMQGDITFDGAITVDDYGYLDYVFSSQVYGSLGNAAPSPGAPAAMEVVPEPASGFLFLFSAIGLAGARVRKRSI